MLADDVETSGACGWTLAISPLLDLVGQLCWRCNEETASLHIWGMRMDLVGQLCFCNCCRCPFWQKQKQSLQRGYGCQERDGIFRSERGDRSRNKSLGLRETALSFPIPPSQFWFNSQDWCVTNIETRLFNNQCLAPTIKLNWTRRGHVLCFAK